MEQRTKWQNLHSKLSVSNFVSGHFITLPYTISGQLKAEMTAHNSAPESDILNWA